MDKPIIWVIDFDYIDNPLGMSVKNLFGPRDATEEDLVFCTQKFRMYDDDGNLYYQGRMSDSCDFEPLDHYGMPNAGCTEIRLLEGDKWVTL